MVPWTQFTSSQLPLWGGRSGGGEEEWKWHFPLLLMACWTKFPLICHWESLLSLLSYLALRASFIKCTLCSCPSGRYISIFSVTLHTLVHYSFLIFPTVPTLSTSAKFLLPSRIYWNILLYEVSWNFTSGNNFQPHFQTVCVWVPCKTRCLLLDIAAEFSAQPLTKFRLLESYFRIIESYLLFCTALMMTPVPLNTYICCSNHLWICTKYFQSTKYTNH